MSANLNNRNAAEELETLQDFLSRLHQLEPAGPIYVWCKCGEEVMSWTFRRRPRCEIKSVIEYPMGVDWKHTHVFRGPGFCEVTEFATPLNNVVDEGDETIITCNCGEFSIKEPLTGHRFLERSSSNFPATIDAKFAKNGHVARGTEDCEVAA